MKLLPSKNLIKTMEEGDSIVLCGQTFSLESHGKDYPGVAKKWYFSRKATQGDVAYKKYGWVHIRDTQDRAAMSKDALADIIHNGTFVIR